uniref:Uncharacterized protein n=1 Tax=Candidatus Kentrum sp. LPFa TaxID=2126335 RepID=A0A450W048_9GAMM|nr:MAG: hypothetical protein BECKLPF1236A_GA0070988_1003710 [Candidatus Kentron sp. LPFa]
MEAPTATLMSLFSMGSQPTSAKANIAVVAYGLDRTRLKYTLSFQGRGEDFRGVDLSTVKYGDSRARSTSPNSRVNA